MPTVVKIRHSLYQDGEAAGLEPAALVQLGHIFRPGVDVRRLRPGDRLILIRSLALGGKDGIPAGTILAAELRTRGKTYRRFRLAVRGRKPIYVGPEGIQQGLVFLRYPLHFRTISSPFSLRRFHPIEKVWRPHWGVDLAAPVGTPVKASADATVAFAGTEGGYGKLVELRYDHHISMRYGHLSRFAKGIRRGQKVKMGQVIGYVGFSGESTGPHLHYEVRINGVPKNPVTVALPNGRPVSPHLLAEFRRVKARYVADFDRVDAATQVAQR